MGFGENIRQLRYQRNISQNTLASRLGYNSFTTIQKWESGDSMPRSNTIDRLCEIFGVSREALLSDEPISAASNFNSATNNQDPLMKYRPFMPTGYRLSCSYRENPDRTKSIINLSLHYPEGYYIDISEDALNETIEDALVMIQSRLDRLKKHRS